MKKVILFKVKQHGFSAWNMVSVLVFLLLAVFMLIAFDRTQTSTEENQLNVTRQAVIRASVSCYAVEGFYPDSLEYLEEHYGVMVDHNRYVVVYEPVGSNMLPSVTVSERGSDLT